MKIIFSWLLLFGMLPFGHAQIATILNKEGKTPLESVLIYSKIPDLQRITNKKG